MSSFLLQLDTATQVSALINDGKDSTESEVVTLGIEYDSDVVEIKVWGQIDPDSSLNPGLGVNEGEAAWMPATPSLVVALEEGGGPRQLHVRVKDDVWNEATATASVFVGQPPSLPVPSPRPGGHSPPRREAEGRRVVGGARLEIRGRYAATASAGGLARIGTRSSGEVAAGLVATSSLAATTTAALGVRRAEGFAVGVGSRSKITKGLGNDSEAAISLLL